MLQFILDTDMLTLYQRGVSAVVQAISTRSTDTVAISVITIEEQTLGWITLTRQGSQVDRLAAAYEGLAQAATSWADFVIAPFPASAINIFRQLHRQRLNVSSNDLRIAAIALDAGLTVVTRNSRDFGRVPGLAAVDWSQ